LDAQNIIRRRSNEGFGSNKYVERCTIMEQGRHTKGNKYVVPLFGEK